MVSGSKVFVRVEEAKEGESMAVEEFKGGVSVGAEEAEEEPSNAFKESKGEGYVGIKEARGEASVRPEPETTIVSQSFGVTRYPL
jgi:hypothetical protein